MKTKKLIITEDGSHTLFIPELNEHYHSIHGAVAESRHVFIEAGLKPKIIENKKLNVLEVGLGTGLNAALALVAAEENQIQLNYFAVEPFPISAEDMMQLNYSKVSESTRMNEVIPAIHAASRDNAVHISPYFVFNYFEKRIQNIEFENDFFDVVFFDAFSPGVQPEMWTMDVFQKIAAAMKPGAVLVTYVAKGEVRRTMKACGLSIEKLPGFGGKREMTRATKNVF
ncbi:MAG TPA: tRNA (5-methylaminomethyl-2-thiouridine)(34)-methyltransferase MnmD, partial [Bacteroidales bacterium]|nr:tRNA (5-methylaminomethyl-2-thiouridine)(34)-methyltransferase MnmD [Bacteroidales bacterium]